MGVFLEPAPCGLNEQFGLRPGDEHIRGDQKIQAIEFPMAEYIRQRNAKLKLREGGDQVSLLLGVQFGFGVSDHPGARAAKHVSKQELCIETG